MEMGISALFNPTGTATNSNIDLLYWPKPPLLYPDVDHIHKGYRRSVYGSHSIYYRIDPEEIVIVRILGREDPEKQF